MTGIFGSHRRETVHRHRDPRRSAWVPGIKGVPLSSRGLVPDCWYRGRDVLAPDESTGNSPPMPTFEESWAK